IVPRSVVPGGYRYSVMVMPCVWPRVRKLGSAACAIWPASAKTATVLVFGLSLWIALAHEPPRMAGVVPTLDSSGDCGLPTSGAIGDAGESWITLLWARIGAAARDMVLSGP